MIARNPFLVLVSDRRIGEWEATKGLAAAYGKGQSGTTPRNLLSSNPAQLVLHAEEIPPRRSTGLELDPDYCGVGTPHRF